MCKVKVYAKSAVDLHAKIGSYAYLFDGISERYKGISRFKNKVMTLTQADCAAYSNALHILSKMACAPNVTEIEIITDSSKVIAFLDVFKAEKYCEVICRYWFGVTKPTFCNLKKMTFIKTHGKVIAGDNDTLRIHDLHAMATGELNNQTNLLK